MEILHFPDETLIQLYSFLPTRALFRLRSTCNRLYHLVRERELIEHYVQDIARARVREDIAVSCNLETFVVFELEDDDFARYGDKVNK